ncbi:type III-A CRISPR-associated protein Cas10/Csm1 [Archaeoglobales archaeon]|nr:MAG: type III-A CRISPR-associated protein Cas10/Csm1 [Archaeoglobales archaeon]
MNNSEIQKVTATLLNLGDLIRRYKLLKGMDARNPAEETSEFLKRYGLELPNEAEKAWEITAVEAGIPFDFKDPMLSLLSTVDIGKGESSEKYFDVGELEIKPTGYLALRPKQKSEAKVDYSFWDRMKEDIDKVLKSELDPNKKLFTLANLLKKYAFFVPDERMPDVSLCEHLRLSAIFTYCMLKDRTKFLLIRGDVSGIQEFISKITYTKALRFLKGRSFYLELLNMAAALRIVKELGIPLIQILSCAAGNFLVVAPSNAANKMHEVAKKINRELLEKGIYIAIAWKEFEFDRAKQFSKLIDEIEEEIRIKKARKYSELSYEEVFGLKMGDECEICGRDAKLEKIELREEGKEFEACPLCNEIYKLSKELVNLEGKWINVYIDNVPNHAVPILGIGFSISNLEKADYAFKINSTDFLSEIENTGLGFRFFNTQAADTRIDEIAKYSEGADCIGILKLDGDNMGEIFSHGINNWWRKRGVNKDLMCPARYATLSSLIELFYGYIVEIICLKGKFFTKKKAFEESGIYVIYSGGDDLFAVGPWNQIIDLAIKIREEYEEFTQNPNFTISAGIYVCEKKFPIYKSFQITVDALEDAKERFRDTGKDAISLFNEKIRFKDALKARELKEKFAYSINRASRSLLFAVANALNGSGKYRRRWAAKYVVARYQERYGELEWLDRAIDEFFRSKNFHSVFFVSLRWAELETRREVR